MDDLIGPVTGRTTVIRSEKTSEARSLETLVTIVVAVLVVAALAMGRQIFVPLAIAVLLSFVMAPLVKILRGFQLSRGLSISVVVIIVGIFVTAFGLLVARQISDLSTDLPSYQQTIARKIENLRGAATQTTIISRASEAIDTLSKALSRRPPQEQPGTDPQPDGNSETAQTPPIPVEVQPASDPLGIMKTVAQTVLEPLVTTGIVVVFVVFILMQREDVRDRLIRLAGAQDLHRTTLAIDDAARRLSRFFLVQTLLNISFGIIVGIGLFLIGVPSALLWGSLAAVMRFVPYVGAILSAAFPIALAAAVDPGWSMVWMTGALFLVIEPIIGQFIEPLLYGHSTGLSPLAVIVSAMFWTWLWGPVGLLLSTPLTVCLVVLGRHVERLEFLDVLLGDSPPLTATESFYQRLLAGDAEEVLEHAERYLETHSISELYDDVALRALSLAREDVRRGMLDSKRQIRIRDTMRALIDELEDYEDLAPVVNSDETEHKPKPGSTPLVERRTVAPVLRPEEISGAWQLPDAILVVAGRGPIDEAGTSLFVSLLHKHGLQARAIAPDIFSTSIEMTTVQLTCLCFVGSDNTRAQVRFGLRRLRRRMSNPNLLACFWTGEQTTEFKELCALAEGSPCAATFGSALPICIDAARRKVSETSGKTLTDVA